MGTIGRNQACQCGSGRKFKHCCMARHHLKPEAQDEGRLLQQALGSHRRGDLAAADKACIDVLRLNPRNAEAMHLRGVIAGQQGAFERAIAWLGQATKLKPTMVQAHNNLGLFLQPLGRNNEAEASLREALRLAPDDPQAHNNLANLLVATARAGEAVGHYRRAIALNSEYAEAHFNLGLALQHANAVQESVLALRRAIVLRPKWAAAHQGLGVSLQMQGRLAEAEMAFQEALAIEPNAPATHNGLGNVRLAQTRVSDAIACYTKAIDLNTTYAEAFQNRGVAHEELDEPAIALRDYEMALELSPGSVEAMLGIARVHQTQGEFSAAESIYTAVIAAHKDAVDAYVGLVGGKRITDDDRPLLVSMEALLNTALSSGKRAALQGALGKAYDALGDYDKAFTHFAAAKRARSSVMTFDRAAHAAKIDAIIESDRRARRSTTLSAAGASELPVFVVGMPRSGTTLVAQILAAHPRIEEVGESPFWARHASDVQRRAGGEADRLAAERYIRMISAKAPDAWRVVDKLTTNFMRLGTICSVLPRARVIHCTRNPLDTCLSVYFTQFRSGHSYSADLDDIAFYYRHYLKLMAHWRATLSRETFHEVRYESLVVDVRITAQAMVKSIGLDWNEQCLAFADNNKAVRTASKWQVRQPVYRHSVNRWRHYQRFIGPLLSLAEA